MYIDMYETLSIQIEGYLRLALLPGVIRYKDEIYTCISTPRRFFSEFYPGDIAPADIANMYSKPKHRGYTVQWIAKVQDAYMLSASPHLVPAHGSLENSAASPFSAVETLAAGVVAANCDHEVDTRHMAEPTGDNKKVFLFDLGTQSLDTKSEGIGVVLLPRSPELRFFALTRHGRTTACATAIQERACLDFCIQLCVLIKARVLIHAC